MCISAYMYVSQAVGTHGSQKTVSDPLELELWVVADHHVGAASPTGVLYKSNECS